MNIDNRNEINKEANDLLGKLDLPAKRSSDFYLGGQAQAVDLFFRFKPLDIGNFNQNTSYELWIFDAKSRSVVSSYVFPLNPQNINISVPTATVLEATMKGVYETNNGAPFRQISISGTTGTLSKAPKTTSPPSTTIKAGSEAVNRALDYAFKNTIKAFNGVQDQVNRTRSAFNGGQQKNEGPLNLKKTEITINSTLMTGFEAIHDLQRFLDYYLAGKKLAANKSWRLYLLMHKDQQYYACSLSNYSITKSAGTTEYQYSINMTAYRREASLPNLSPRKTDVSGGQALSNKLSNALNALRQARRTIAESHRVLAGIRSDINESLITPLGECVLLTKDIVGAAQSMYDFAFSGETVKAMQESFKQYYTSNRDNMQWVSAAIGSPSSNRPALVGALGANGQGQSAMNTSAQDKLSSSKAQQFQQDSDTSDPLTTLFDNPADHPDVFEGFPVDDMNLSSEITDQLNSIVSNVSSFTADDIIERREKIADFARSVSEALGGGSSTYNRVKGLGEVKKTYKKLSVDDVILLNNLNDTIRQLDTIASEFDQADSSGQDDYYRFYSDYAISQGMKFSGDNISRFFVPFPVGGTLEQLATAYLGSPERWIEIAALNALKAPYVDEDGYDIKVTASPGGNTLSVANPESLYVGQVVRVVSDVERSTVRKVRSIDVVSSVEAIVTFESSTSPIPLTAYKPSQNARIHAFMPNTVNSDMLIAIPSSAPPTNNTILKISPELADLDPIIRNSKVDLLQDSSGDWVFTGGGDVKLAYGLTNLIQAANMIIRTQTNTLLQNPGFGNPLDAGVSSADVTADQIFKALQRAFDEDPRFSGVIAGEVQMSGPTVSVTLLLGIKNTQVTLPVQAQLPR